MTLAGFWIRFLAYFVDSILFTILYVLVVLIETHLFLSDFKSSNLNATILIQMTSWALCIGYSAYFESSKWQATPGKMLMRLVVTDINGDRISFARAFCRYLSKLLSFLIFLTGFLFILFTEKNKHYTI